MALTDNISAYWKLDESSGNPADATGNGNTLTNNNTVTYAAAKINNGSTFAAASSQNFSITNASQTGLNLTGDYSFNFWLNLTNLPGATDYGLIYKYNLDTAPNGYDMHIDHTSAAIWFEVVGDGVSTSLLQAKVNTALTTPTDVGSWHMWSFVYHLANPATVIIYKDGSSVAFTYSFQQITTSNSTNTEVWRMGAANNNSGALQFLNGSMDEVGLWARQLSSGEITTLYNGGAGLQYPFTVAGATRDARELNLLGAG